MAKSRDIPIVFLLHNFSYRHRGVFRATDYVVVPSDFSRQYHWERVGLACQVLPNVVDWQRVHVANRDPRYVTFVNPHMVKGVYVFARIAEQLARRRPDIPLLVVEGRRTTETLTQTGIDLSGVRELRCMKNTPDPRDFYRVTKLLLMPSLWNESFAATQESCSIFRPGTHPLPAQPRDRKRSSRGWRPSADCGTTNRRTAI
jgi:glycosyltransferase involved in cell wall biosynthesis